MSSKAAVLWDVFLMCVYAGIAVLIVVGYLHGPVRAPQAALGVIVFGFGAFRQAMFVRHRDVPDDPEKD
jgi:4-hydroxybenzoate polyprenyltransferase